MSDDTQANIALAIASARAGVAQLDGAIKTLGDLLAGLVSAPTTPPVEPPVEQPVITPPVEPPPVEPPPVVTPPVIPPATSVQVPTDILADVALWGTAYDPATLPQLTDANSPIRSATSFFGAPGLVFDGARDALIVQNVRMGTDKFALFISIAMGHSGMGRYATLQATTSANPDYAGAENVVLLADNGSDKTSASTLIPINTYRAMSGFSRDVDANVPVNVAIIYDGAHGKVYANGVFLGQNTAKGALGDLCNFALGAGYADSNTLSDFGKCVIQSWCLARGEITDAQRIAMDAWLTAPTGVQPTRQKTITGLKSLVTTGTMAAGSDMIDVADGSGFDVGDSIIVEVGGEADAYHSVAPGWPYISYPSVAAMNADNTRDQGTYCWINAGSKIGKVYQFWGAWQAEPTSYFDHFHKNSLCAKIIAKPSANRFQLDLHCQDATTNARVIFNNLPVLNALSGPENTTFTFPVTPGPVNYYFGGPGVGDGIIAPTFISRVGWVIDGLDAAKCRLVLPKGVACVGPYFQTCTNVVVQNIGLDGNMEYGHIPSQYPVPPRAALLMRPNIQKGFFFSACKDSYFRNCEVVNFGMQAFGAAYSDGCWAEDCVSIQPIAFNGYTQWMFLWSDCGSSGQHATGGTRRCRLEAAKITACAEMFRSYGIEHIDFTAINGIFSMNTTEACAYRRLKSTLQANSHNTDVPDVMRNPMLNINNNVGTSSGSGNLGNGNILEDLCLIQEGYLNPNHEIMAFILGVGDGTQITSTSQRRQTGVEDFKGYYECPPFDPASGGFYRGADLRFGDLFTLFSNQRVVGTTMPGLPTLGLHNGVVTPDSGTVEHCVLPDDGMGHPSVAGAFVINDNITNEEWRAGAK